MIAEITALWQADEVRSRRPRVVDEIRHALWFFETTLLDVAPDVLAEYRERLPGAPAPLRFGSWVGGDQDGNPEAGPHTVPEWLDRARRLALTRYRVEVRAARARDRRLDAHGAGQRRAAALDRARRGRAGGVRASRSATRTSTSRTAAS